MQRRLACSAALLSSGGHSTKRNAVLRASSRSQPLTSHPALSNSVFITKCGFADSAATAAASAIHEQTRWAHTSTTQHTASHAASSSSSTRTAASASLTLSNSSHKLHRATTLSILNGFVQQRDYEGCARFYEQHFDPARQHFIHDFCHGFAGDARDALLLLMRVYTNMGRIDRVRDVLSVGLRDLAAVERAMDTTPLSYADLGRQAGGEEWNNRSGDEETQHSSSSGQGRLSLPQQDNLLPLTSSAASAEDTQNSVFAWCRESLLNSSVFNAYLEVLTKRNKFSVPEVSFILEQMSAAGVARDALTYHYLIELHVRAGYDPQGLWEEMKSQTPPLQPLPATVQTLLLRVVPSSPDPAFVVDVTKAALGFGTAVMDKRMLSEMIEQWLMGTAAVSPAASGDAPPIQTQGQPHSTTPAQAARLHLGAAGGSNAKTNLYPPEYILWLMLELELRCVLDKASFMQYVERHHLTELLLRCAKCTDAGTAEQVLALMDRHAVPKTADVLALVVWCWSQALEVEKTLDLIEWMALKGYLDQVDCFRKAYIDSLRYTMEQHYLMTFADTLSGSPALVARALAHLRVRRQRGELVSAHTLDLIVLSYARAGEERKALQLVATYESRWDVSPRTNTFNSLLVGCSRHRSTMLHRVVYTTMLNSGVVANVFTFRVLIRQAVVSGNIDEAMFYLEEVTKHPGLRVEVEMILPILERAARVGDVDTANRISQYSLKCDIGIDGGVLRSAMQQLAEAGQSVEVLKGQLPLHEALRSRSKTGRQRARNEVLL